MNALSAVVVPIPAADALVGRLRAELDPAAALGVPAHVSVMVPFLDPAALDATTLADLAATVARVPAFDVRFDRIRWFDAHLVWLAPEPADPFSALTDAVAERFGTRPYGGTHEPVPHLTVGNGAPVERLRQAADELVGGLPVRMAVEHAVVMTGTRAPGSWTVRATLPLGTRSGTGERIER